MSLGTHLETLFPGGCVSVNKFSMLSEKRVPLKVPQILYQSLSVLPRILDKIYYPK